MKRYTIRHILVPTDFSRISLRALHHATIVAERARCRLTLLNVVEPFGDAYGTSGMLAAAARLEEKRKRESERRLKNLGRTVAAKSGVKPGVVVAIGSVGTTINRIASGLRVDLIVMGTHGASGFMESLLGSNTYRVVNLADAPVMSVHTRSRARGFDHIIYPVRDRAGASDKFEQALAFAKLFRARVHVMGFTPPGRKKEADAMRSLCAGVARKFSRAKTPVTTIYSDANNPTDAVVRYAHKNKGSLVVISEDSSIRLSEMFRGTFTKRILHHMLSPVLSVGSRS